MFRSSLPVGGRLPFPLFTSHTHSATLGSFIYKISDFLVLLRFATPFYLGKLATSRHFSAVASLPLNFGYYGTPSADFLHNLATCYGCKALQPINTSLVWLLFGLVPRPHFPPHYFAPVAATPPCVPRKKTPLRSDFLLRYFGAFIRGTAQSSFINRSYLTIYKTAFIPIMPINKKKL